MLILATCSESELNYAGNVFFVGENSSLQQTISKSHRVIEKLKDSFVFETSTLRNERYET